MSTLVVVVCLPRNPVVEQFRCLKKRAIEIQGAWRACNFTAYRGTKKILTTTHEKKSVPQHDAYWTVEGEVLNFRLIRLIKYEIYKYYLIN